MREGTEPYPVFEDHIGLVKSIVRSFDRSCRADDSELFPVACMGLMKAMATHDPAKSKFSYWATKIIKNSLLKEIKKNVASPKPVGFVGDETALCEDRHDMPLDLIPVLTRDSEQDTPYESENRRILVRHFLEGIPMAEIAREIGFTRESVRQRVRKAIESIRDRHGEILDNHAYWLTDGSKI